jgi:serralysin
MMAGGGLGGSYEGPTIELARDGRIYAAGTIVVDGDDEMIVLRYSANGTPDTTFGPDGRQIVSRPHGYDAARALALQTDGKLLVGGRVFTPTGARRALASFLFWTP